MSYRLRVNPITCEAHGMCHELLPERIDLDEWGYPMFDSRPLSPSSSIMPVVRPRPARPSPSWSSAKSSRAVTEFPRRGTASLLPTVENPGYAG